MVQLFECPHQVSMEPQIGIRGRRGTWTKTPYLHIVSMEPQIGIRGRHPDRAQDRWTEGVSMEPQIGIRGRGQALPLIAEQLGFQWSPRLVSGEGGARSNHHQRGDLVSMEPQIGIRGRAMTLDPGYRFVAFQWSPRLVSGEGDGKCFRPFSISFRFNGAPDWYPGKGLRNY